MSTAIALSREESRREGEEELKNSRPGVLRGGQLLQYLSRCAATSQSFNWGRHVEQYHAAVTVYRALYSHCAVTVHSHDAPAIVNHAMPQSLCNNHSGPDAVHSHNTPVVVLSHSALHNHCVQVTMSQSPCTSPWPMQSQHHSHFCGHCANPVWWEIKISNQTSAAGTVMCTAQKKSHWQGWHTSGRFDQARKDWEHRPRALRDTEKLSEEKKKKKAHGEEEGHRHAKFTDPQQEGLSGSKGWRAGQAKGEG